MKVSQIILLLSSIMVVDAANTSAKQPKAKKAVKAEAKTARIVNTQSDGNSANMAGLMARVRRGGWDRN